MSDQQQENEDNEQQQEMEQKPENDGENLPEDVPEGHPFLVHNSTHNCYIFDGKFECATCICGELMQKSNGILEPLAESLDYFIKRNTSLLTFTVKYTVSSFSNVLIPVIKNDLHCMLMVYKAVKAMIQMAHDNNLQDEIKYLECWDTAVKHLAQIKYNVSKHQAALRNIKVQETQL